MYRAPGSTVQVSIEVADLSSAAVGVQLLVEWDSSELTFVSASGQGAFQLIRDPLLLDVPGSPTRQRLAVATGLVEGGAGVTSGVLGGITFEVAAGALVCAPESLLDFGPNDTVYSTKLSASGGASIPFAGLEDVIFGTDTVAPELVGLPSSVVLSPGTTTSSELDAFLSAAVSAEDACSASVVRAVTLPGGGTSDAFPSVFPEGVTTVVWTATDGSSNSATATRTVTVEPCPGPFVTYYLDTDSDGFGQSAATAVTCVGAPSGYAIADGDCDDANNAVNPGAAELCNGIDDNCAGGIDEGFTDTDGDGVADCVDDDRDGDGYDNDVDQCPDTYALSAPIVFYADFDNDGAGDPDGYVVACSAPGADWLTVAGDGCPADPAKLAPGTCGCGVADTDTDGDSVPDCIDNCVATPNPSQVDCDSDGYGDDCSTAPDCNSNGVPDSCDIATGQSADADGNGVPDSCQADCDGNSLPDTYDLSVTPWRDFDANGTLDVCEGRTYWIGGASANLADASSWSGGVPAGPVPAVFATGGPVTAVSSGGTLSADIVVRSGAVTIVTFAPLSVQSLSIEAGASLAVSGRLAVLGDATVLTDGRLALSFNGWLAVSGRLDCRQQSKVGLGLRLSDEPFVAVGSGSFLGGIDVDLGSVSPWTVEAGTRFALIQTPSLESDGFFASLFAPGFGPNLLAVVGPQGAPEEAERLEVEVLPVTQLLQPEEDGYTSVTGTPTALEVAQLTSDEYADVAVTVSFGSDQNGVLYVLQSDGMGGFGEQATLPTDRDPRGVRAGRFDDTDQTIDLAVVSAASATLRAYRNLSQTVAGFVAAAPVTTVADPRALASVTPAPAGAGGGLQLGTDSVVVAGGGSNSLQGFSSEGEADFVAKNVIQVGRRPGGVSTRPGSSKPDRGVTAALSSITEGGPGEVVTVSVDAQGELALTGSALGPSAPTDIECRDLDGDGLPDAVVAAENGTVSVLRGTPSGFAFSGSFPVGALPARDGALGDFDGDGRLDLAVASRGSEGKSGSQVSLFLNESVPGGAPTFRPAGTFAEDKGVRLLESGRLTQDLTDGLVTVSDEVSGTSSLAGAPVGTVTIVRFTTPEFVPCLGDFDGNRTIDGVDLCHLLHAWDRPGLTDLNGDGITDSYDLAILLARWGPCDS